MAPDSRGGASGAPRVFPLLKVSESSWLATYQALPGTELREHFALISMGDLLDVIQMDLDIGPYRIRLLRDAAVPAFDEKPRPFRSLPLARIGPVELHASLADGTLQEWCDIVQATTRNRTQFQAIAVNGIPGFKLPPGERRLDYAFQRPGDKRIELVAWSDLPISEDQRETVEAIIQTLEVPPRIIFSE